MTRRVYLYFALTFLLGIVAGGAGLFFYASQTGHWHRSFGRQRVIERMTKDLDLSPDQVQQLRKILDDSGPKYRQIEDQVEAQVDALHARDRVLIRQILKPEQVTKFDEIVREREAQRQHERRVRRGAT